MSGAYFEGGAAESSAIIEAGQGFAGKCGEIGPVEPQGEISAPPAPRLSEREMMALNALAGCYQDEGNFLSFAAIARRSGLDPLHVRRSVRSLARKGFAEYGKGLWHWDGDGPAGAGYCCTAAGFKAASNPIMDDYS